MGVILLKHPPHPFEALAASQVRLTIFLDLTLLNEMPKGSPSPIGLWMTSAVNWLATEFNATLRNVADEYGIELSFVYRPITWEKQQGRRHHLAPLPGSQTNRLSFLVER